jgi:hypothetical protein
MPSVPASETSDPATPAGRRATTAAKTRKRSAGSDRVIDMQNLTAAATANADPVAMTRNLAARAAMRNASDKPPGGSSVQLPLWDDSLRGLPNALARSALFTCNRTGERDFHKSLKVSSLSNINIVYRGVSLQQDDASVFMQLLHIAREKPLGSPVDFVAYHMMKSLGWSINSRSYARLRETIERLSATNLTVSADKGKVGYGGSLVRAFIWKRLDTDEPLTHWQVLLEPGIVQLFQADTFTLMEWKERLQIGNRAVLAQWLHSYLCTHAEPIPLSVDKYYELSGSTAKRLYHFRSDLRKALERLIAIKFLKRFEITAKDIVVVEREPRKPMRRLTKLDVEMAELVIEG